MGMEFEIFDKDKYRQELINYYNSILDRRFLNLNPYESSNEELMNNILDGIPTDSSIWDINKNCCIQTLDEYSSKVICLLLHSSGLLISAYNDRTIKIWKNQ